LTFFNAVSKLKIRRSYIYASIRCQIIKKPFRIPSRKAQDRRVILSHLFDLEHNFNSESEHNVNRTKGTFMPKTNLSVQYHNFHPSQATKEFIESILTDLKQELPGGAAAKATFTVKDKVVKGMLQIGSHQGPFFSSASAENLHEVTVKLVAKLRRRMEKFKSKRRSHEGLKQNIKKHVYNSEPMVTDVAS
jgi:ribosome-associated translation inhibitor RaiA